jgi:UDP-N-acetylglucosamine 2-epimerase (non-hydrolysing)
MTPTLKVMCVLGTRPEAIKLAPVALAVHRLADQFAVSVVATGQHREMATLALAAFGVSADVDLDVMTPHQRPTDVIARVLTALPSVFERHRPDVVLVQGDTATTVAAALAAYHSEIAVGHVEAGLRTGDRYSPFPEEMNRRLTTRLASYHFAPTRLASDRLLAEGVDPRTVIMTGNTVVDALCRLRATATPPRGINLTDRQRMILLTVHRRENHGARLLDICAAVRDIVRARRDVVVLCPVHPNPDVQRRVYQELAIERIQLMPPLDYPELLWVLDRSFLVLTDSGGLQEEAPAFHKPVLVLRESTERPEGIDGGVAKLVGTARERIVSETLRVLDDEDEYLRMRTRENPFGDGHAAERILHFLATNHPRQAAAEWQLSHRA